MWCTTNTQYILGTLDVFCLPFGALWTWWKPWSKTNFSMIRHTMLFPGFNFREKNAQVENVCSFRKFQWCSEPTWTWRKMYGNLWEGLKFMTVLPCLASHAHSLPSWWRGRQFLWWRWVHNVKCSSGQKMLRKCCDKVQEECFLRSELTLDWYNLDLEKKKTKSFWKLP